MKMFLTASAIVGWAGLKPRNDQSAGKIKSRKITHGNKYLVKYWWKQPGVRLEQKTVGS